MKTTNDYLLQVRKGATATFRKGQWLQVIEALGIKDVPDMEWFYYGRYFAQAERGYDIKVLASRKLKMKTVAEEKAAKAPKRSNVGTCACCFGSYKLTDDKTMVLHGYKRPGHGYIQGRCPGQAFQCYELSNAGTVCMLENYVKPALEGLKLHLAHLTTEPEEIMDTYSRQLKVIKKGEPNYGYMLRNQIQDTEWKIKSTERDIATLTKKVVDWKFTDLPA